MVFQYSQSSSIELCYKPYTKVENKDGCLFNIKRPWDNVVKTIITCCVAHNVSQKRGDLYMDDDEVLENVLINEGLMRGGYNNNQNCPDADALRDVLAEYMFDNI